MGDDSSPSHTSHPNGSHSHRTRHLLALEVTWRNPVHWSWRALHFHRPEITLVRLPGDIRAAVPGGCSVLGQLTVQGGASDQFLSSITTRIIRRARIRVRSDREIVSWPLPVEHPWFDEAWPVVDLHDAVSNVKTTVPTRRLGRFSF